MNQITENEDARRFDDEDMNGKAMMLKGRRREVC